MVVGLVVLVAYAWFFVLSMTFCLSGVAAVFLMAELGYPSKLFFPIGGAVGVVALILLVGGQGKNEE